MAPTRRVTQADLARRAGVSRSCVSRVVRGLDKVSDDKRERILAAARELGYIDNGLATALAGNRRRRLVGFLPQEISNTVFGDVYDSLKAGLGPEGCQLVIVEGSFDPDDEDARLRELVSFAPDCIVVAGYAGSTDALAAAVHSIPIVSVTRRVDEDRVISVMGDDRAGAALAVEHLVGLGHERIAHLQLPPTIPYEGRAAGYTAAMEDAGLAPRLVTPRTQGRRDAREAARALFATGAAHRRLLRQRPHGARRPGGPARRRCRTSPGRSPSSATTLRARPAPPDRRPSTRGPPSRGASRPASSAPSRGRGRRGGRRTLPPGPGAGPRRAAGDGAAEARRSGDARPGGARGSGRGSGGPPH